MAIRKHIGSNKALAGRIIDICIDKASIGRIIVAGLEVVIAGFAVVVIAAIAKRVLFCHAAGSVKDITPRVVGIACSDSSVRSDQLHYVTLQVQDIVIRREVRTVRGIEHGKWGARRPPPVAEPREASEWQQQGDWRA